MQSDKPDPTGDVPGYVPSEAEVEAIVSAVARKFRSFGGAKADTNNPISMAMEGRPAQFAAGVDIADVVAFILAAASVRTEQTEGWRCFHCDEVFHEDFKARQHFGESCDCEPLCQVAGERFREVERQLAEYQSESDATSKTFYALGADHYRKERDAEQKGYDKGLADAKAHPETLGLCPLPPPPSSTEGAV